MTPTKESFFGESNHIYRFGDGRKVNALHSVKIPAIIGTRNLGIETDVADSDIPLIILNIVNEKSQYELEFPKQHNKYIR